MGDEKLKAYARYLLVEHARDIEGLTVYEMADDYFEGAEGFDPEEGLSNEDMRKVRGFIEKAIVTVDFRD